MPRKWVEKRKRGFFGYVFMLLFWTWQIFMVYWIIKGGSDAMGPNYNSLPKDQQETIAAGLGMAFVVQMMVWAVGSVVFGLLAYFTRGKREMIEVPA